MSILLYTNCRVFTFIRDSFHFVLPYILHSNLFLYRDEKTIQCFLILDIPGETLQGYPLRILQRGENYLNDKGVFRGGDLEILLDVFRVLPSTMKAGGKGQQVPDYSKLMKNFIDTSCAYVRSVPLYPFFISFLSFCTNLFLLFQKTILQKYVTVCNHLRHMPKVLQLLKKHYQHSLYTSKWKLSRCNIAALWELEEHRIVYYMTKILAERSVITSASILRDTIDRDFARRDLAVHIFPSSLLFYMFICLFF